MDCSLLPSEPLELPISFVPVEELDAEVGRSREMLGRVWNEIEVRLSIVNAHSAAYGGVCSCLQEAEKAGPLSKAQAREMPVTKDLAGASYLLSSLLC